MKRLLHLLPIALLAACGKGELDPAGLRSNPFDADYDGEAVFVLDTTFVRIVNTGSGPLPQQVIGFHTRSELLPDEARYSVQVSDPGQGLTTTVEPLAPGGHDFEYVRLGTQPGVPVCVRLSLFNDQSAARAEEICATL